MLYRSLSTPKGGLSLSYYQFIDNQFPDGYYPYVHVVTLYDEYVFKHEFFLQIAQLFSMIKKIRFN